MNRSRLSLDAFKEPTSASCPPAGRTLSAVTNEHVHDDECCPSRRRLRELAFDKIAESYLADARKDFSRSSLFAVVGAGLVLAGGAVGAFVINKAAGELGRGIGIAVTLTIASLPFWWQSERGRRSGLENRRLGRQLVSVEPFLDGFVEPAETVLRAALAQRLFARIEGADPLGASRWPTGPELAGRAPEVKPPT